MTIDKEMRVHLLKQVEKIGRIAGEQFSAEKGCEVLSILVHVYEVGHQDGSSETMCEGVSRV